MSSPVSERPFAAQAVFSARRAQGRRMEDGDTHETVVDVAVEEGHLDRLRAQCDALTSLDGIDKSTALGITKLFHSAETLLLHEAAERRMQ